MRAELAATFLHQPAVVYLDEPTIGLDVFVKERIRAFIQQDNRERGTTVVLTTHDLGDIEELCRRVLVIDQGRLLFDGPLAAIKERFGRHRQIAFDTAADAPADLPLPPGAEVIERGPRRLRLRFDRGATTASQVAAAVMARVEVLDFSLSEPDLASVVKQLYGSAPRAGPPAATAVPAVPSAAGSGP
jgi:ABC-2 type transport system ATP-binding protein